DLLQPGAGELFQRVVHHRPRPDRQQVLVRDARQLAHAGALAARQNHAANGHLFSSSKVVRSQVIKSKTFTLQVLDFTTCDLTTLDFTPTLRLSTTPKSRIVSRSSSGIPCC